MTGPARGVIAPATAALLMALGCSGGAEPTTPTAEARPTCRHREVEVVRVRYERMPRRLSTPVTMTAAATGYVRSLVEARVSRVHASVGERVQQGEPLVELDAPQLAEQVRLFERVLRQASIELEQAQQQLASARQDLRVQRSLSSKGSLALIAARRQTVGGPESQARYFTAYRADRRQRSRLAAVAEVVSRGEELVARLTATQQTAQASLDLARTQQEQAVLRAPVGGIVTTRTINPGDVVTAGGEGPPLLTVADPSSVVAVASSPLQTPTPPAPGDVATIELHGHGPLPGTVAGAGEQPLQIKLADGIELAPLAGARGVAHVTLGSRRVALLPLSAIGCDAGEHYVMRARWGGPPERTVVQTGPLARGRIAVVSGLAEGDRVLRQLGCACVAGGAGCSLVEVREGW